MPDTDSIAFNVEMDWITKWIGKHFKKNVFR